MISQPARSKFINGTKPVAEVFGKSNCNVAIVEVFCKENDDRNFVNDMDAEVRRQEQSVMREPDSNIVYNLKRKLDLDKKANASFRALAKRASDDSKIEKVFSALTETLLVNSHRRFGPAMESVVADLHSSILDRAMEPLINKIMAKWLQKRGAPATRKDSLLDKSALIGFALKFDSGTRESAVALFKTAGAQEGERKSRAPVGGSGHDVAAIINASGKSATYFFELMTAFEANPELGFSEENQSLVSNVYSALMKNIKEIYIVDRDVLPVSRKLEFILGVLRNNPNIA